MKLREGLAYFFAAVLALWGIAQVLGASGEGALPRKEKPSGAFFIRPYMVKLTEAEAVLGWTLEGLGKSVVEYGKDLRYGSVVEAGPARFHSVALRGLDPCTRYFYRIDNAFASSFETLCPERPLDFAVIGHTHGTETFDHFPDAFLVEKVRQLSPRWVVHTGDVTYFSNEAHFKEHFFDLFAPLAGEVPVYVAPGNHDSGWPFVYGIDLSLFKKLLPYGYPEKMRDDPGLACYSVDAGGLRLLFFSYVSLKTREAEVRRWLEGAIHRDKFNVVVFGGAQEGYYDRERLLRFLKDEGADLVFNGDGAGFRKESFEGMPLYFVGTGESGPHPFVLARYERPYLTLRAFDCSNRSLGSDLFLTDPSLEGMEKLGAVPMPTVHAASRMRAYEFEWDLPEPSSSEDFSTVAVLLESRAAGSAWMYAAPRQTEKSPYDEGGFRTQYLPVKKGASLLEFRLPPFDPLGDGAAPYGIEKLRLIVAGEEVEGDGELFSVREIYRGKGMDSHGK